MENDQKIKSNNDSMLSTPQASLDAEVFRHLVDVAPFNIIRYDVNGRIIYMNAQLARDIDSVEAVVGKLPNEAWPDKCYDAIQQACAQVVQSGQQVTIELEVPISSKEKVLQQGPFVHKILVAPEWNADGKVIGSVAFGADITALTEYKKSLVERMKLEEQVSGVAASVPGFIFTLRKNAIKKLRFTYASIGIEDLFGLSSTEVCENAAALWSRFHQDDLNTIFATLQNTQQATPLNIDEIRIQHPDKGSRWVEIRSTAKCFVDGSIEWYGIMLDITERKAYEGLIALQNHAMEYIGEAFYLVDMNANVINVNRAATDMLGYSKDELLGMRVPDFDCECNEAQWQLYVDALRSEQTIKLESVHQSKSGMLIPIEVTASRVKQEGEDLMYCLVRDLTERKQFEQKMYHQASYDMLTNLPNRRLFRDSLSAELTIAKRKDSPVSLLFIDLDHFKEVNDTLGHDKGDQLLIDAARRIQACVRESDVVARIGGDEFVIIQVGINDAASLGRVAQAVLEALAKPFNLAGHISYVSASIGIANYPSDVDSTEGLIGAADQAMYAAKEQGRNCFSFFTQSMQDEVQQRLSLGNDLREALNKAQLEVYLQPIIDVATGHVVKAEALLRWKHHQHGMVPPDQFIPIAEEMGLIHDIGDWVFRESALAMSRWLAISTPNNGCCQISVNISPRQFTKSDIGLAWIDYLAEINIPAKRMVVEITENLLLGDEIDTMKKLDRLREAGIGLALDDFGTGYSAMSYLRKFSIDYLKIDRSFVHDIDADENVRTITEAIVVMGHKLGLKMIAEGVETEQQQAILTEMQCNYVQGYLYAKPMPVEDFLSFVSARS